MLRRIFSSFLARKIGVRVISENEFVKYTMSRDLNTLISRNLAYFELFSDSKFKFDEILYSQSQLGQEIFANCINCYETGFFIEVGVGDGISISNTYRLERLGWEGILVEPNPGFKDKLIANRTCNLEFSALWNRSETNLEFVSDGYFSSLSESHANAGNSNADSLPNRPYGKRRTVVDSITFGELLRKFKAPTFIDYISIDVEGGELEILQHFPFDNYKVKCWTIEHNFGPARSKIAKLLLRNGYKQVYADSSMHDDFYVYANVATKLS